MQPHAGRSVSWQPLGESAAAEGLVQGRLCGLMGWVRETPIQSMTTASTTLSSAARFFASVVGRSCQAMEEVVGGLGIYYPAFATTSCL